MLRVLHGNRLLYPPARRPPFDPDESTLAWLRRWQAGGAAELALHGEPLDCTLHPGEAIYFPTGVRKEEEPLTLHAQNAIRLTHPLSWHTAHRLVARDAECG
jgi:hypothetical protein